MSSVKAACLLLLLLMLSACGEIGDDLTPSSHDERPTYEAGTTGWGVGQNAPPFSIMDTDNTMIDLPTALAGKKGVVFYFTMWCPICDSHMSHALSYVMPGFPDVRFYAVDYLAGSVAQAKEAATNAGYANSGFIVLADINRQLAHDYAATMGTTIVIDSSGIIRMNEDYRNGSTLQTVLTSLP